MKQSIKISIIVITAIAIVGLLFYFTKKIDNAEIETIEPQNFLKYIEARVNNEVADKPFDSAKIAFYSIIGEINTEAFIKTGNGSSVLTTEDTDKCKRMAFYAYAPIFAAHGLDYFNSWVNSGADPLRTEANSLLAYGIAEDGTQIKQDLNQIVKIVNEYHEALRVISSASSCTTIEAVNKAINGHKRYMHAPLTNNRNLKTELNNVPNKAKESLVNYILRKANVVIANKYKYDSYAKWYEDYDAKISEIDQYEKAFGKAELLTSKKSDLEQADEDALNYYP